MFELQLERTVQSIDAIKKQIRCSDVVRKLIGSRAIKNADDDAPFDMHEFYASAPDPTEWKIIDHCSAVTQIYAIFEKYVREILKEYLQFLESQFPYTSHDKKLRAEHRKRMGQILIDLDKDRYKNLDLNSVIFDYSNAFVEGQPYKFLPEAMISHDQNLRMSELSAVFDRCGVSDLIVWVSKHKKIKSFFTKEDRQSDTAESELAQLVQYRNDAAHGNVDSVLGADVLLEYADFILVLCEVLAEKTQATLLLRASGEGKSQKFGKITESFSDNRVVAIVGGRTIRVGEKVYLFGPHYCYGVKIISIRENDKSLEEIVVLHDKEVGFRFDGNPEKFAEMYSFSL